MKFRTLLMAMTATVISFVACNKEEDPNDYPAKVEVTPTVLSFSEGESSQNVDITATRNWTASSTAEWVKVATAMGDASVKSQSVAVSVLANTGYNREAEVIFSIGLAKARVTIQQAGPKGVIDNGKGTKESPYSVAGVVAFVNELGADVNSPEKVYVKGKVSEVKDEYTTQYGNGTFTLVDEDDPTGATFIAYRVLYLGNAKFKSSDTQIKVGDEAIIYGNVVNFKGNTPETQQNNAFLYSLNGVDRGGDTGGGTGTTGEAKGTGTEADPFNVAAAIAKAKETGQTATSQEYYIKGKVSEVSEQFGAQYGNASFNLVDEGYTASFIAYRVLYFNNKKWTEGGKTINVNDEVVVCAKIVNFKGNTPETSGGYVYSINGDKGSQGGDETTGEAKGAGTEADPFNVAAAIAKAKETGQTATSQEYYIKGKVSAVTEQFGAQYGNASFNLIDEGYTATFVAYRVLYFNNKKWTEGGKTINVNDEVVVCAKIVNFKDNTPETSGGYVYSINGDKGEQSTSGDPKGTGTLADPFNVDGAVKAIKDGGDQETTADYYVKGKISSIKNVFDTNYGTAIFNISEDGSTTATQFTCYSVYYLENKSWAEGNTQIAVGDEVIVVGKLTNYKGTYETVSKKAYIYSLNGTTSETAGPAFGVKDQAISVSATATEATISVTGNVAWKAESSDATVAPAAGEGAGDIKVTFEANASTEEAKTYKVIVSTEADVATKSFEVIITQAKAGSGNAKVLTFQFSDVSGLTGWPTKADEAKAASNQVYKLEGVDYTFSLSPNVYTSTYNDASYLMLASKTNGGPVYLGLPVLEGCKLVEVTITTSSGASKNACGLISADTNGTVVTGGEKKTLNAQSTDFSWTLTGTEAGKMYYYSSSESKYNSQIVKLVLKYE